MRVVICWFGISGYLTACWRALGSRPGIDLRVVVFPGIGTKDSPYNVDVMAGVACDVVNESRTGDVAHVASLVAAHKPDIVVLPGWAIAAFRGLPSHPSMKGVRFVMTMDTALRNTWRQKLARFRMGRFFDKLDGVIVAGERAWQFARRLVPESKVRRGMYAYDSSLFDPALHRRLEQEGGWPRRFLYCGRYVERKGIVTLLAGYAEYRRRVKDPWPLTTCGAGPQGELVKAAEGVTDLGFVQPADQPEVFSRHGVFILPSNYEPWGVVVAEALGSGLPVICTEEVGASVELVRSHYNGLTFPTGDSAGLARAMEWMHQHPDELPEFGRRGKTYAGAFSEQCWADKWAAVFAELL